MPCLHHDKKGAEENLMARLIALRAGQAISLVPFEGRNLELPCARLATAFILEGTTKGSVASCRPNGGAKEGGRKEYRNSLIAKAQTYLPGNL